MGYAKASKRVFPTARHNPDELFSSRDLLRLIVPLVIEQFLAMFIGMADTLMVSSISESAVSAISLVDQINILLIQLFSAMATGGAVVAAQYLGKCDRESACAAAKQLLYVTLLLSAVIAAASILFCDRLLTACFGSLSVETMAYCRTYLILSALSYPALAAYNGGAALLRAMRNSRASMYTSILMNVVNVSGNALLIYGFGMEVAGAAIASLVSRVMGAVVMVRMLLQPSLPVHLVRPTRPEWDGGMIRRIFRLGIPNGLENSMFQVGKLLVAGMVSTMGESIIAANAVSNNVAGMCNIVGNSIGLGMITVIGQCIGAGDSGQARRYTRRLMAAAYASNAVMYVFLLCFTKEIAGIFHLSPDGISAAVRVLRTYAMFAALIWPASFALPNALRAAGDARFTMTVSTVSMWLFRIAACYVFVGALHMGLLGVWYAMYLDWAARSLCFLLRYRGGKWLTKRVV